MDRTFKEISKVNWAINNELKIHEASLEHVKIGSLQRIADATELMAKNITNLINQVEFLKDENKHLRNALNAEKSAKSRLKNKISKTFADE